MNQLVTDDKINVSYSHIDINDDVVSIINY
jgi:hypothetical protein